MAAELAPMRIGHVALVVNDLERMTAFYADDIGLQRLSGGSDTMRLGAGGTTLLELRQDRSARRHSPREAGLFHTAFLLPSRADLGRWLRHAAARQVQLQGASDHLVSEALYLADPEGNGIEMYADRPRETWEWRDGRVQMATERLDLEDLARAGGSQPWQAAPSGITIGHVHLQVGAIPQAEAFYRALGFDITCRYPGGTFYSTGGYHHHLATNVWNSRGASIRSEITTGLAEVAIVARDPEAIRGRVAALSGAGGAAEEVSPAVPRSESGPVSVLDPWGIPLSFS